MNRFHPLFWISLAAMAAPSASTAAEPAEIGAIRQVLTKQTECWNRGDLDGFMDGYWHSKELTFYSGNQKRSGWDETRERYRKRYQADDKQMGELTFGELEIQELGDGHAVVKGRFRLQLSKEKLEGLFTLIMRKTAAGWRIVHDHTSS